MLSCQYMVVAKYTDVMSVSIFSIYNLNGINDKDKINTLETIRMKLIPNHHLRQN